jgi:CSLREA domain-containing protein
MGALAAALAALMAAGTAEAATLTVTKLDDTRDGACNSDCSLREAIDAANLDATQDTIVLPPGELRLELADAATPEDANVTGDLDVLRDLVIRGAGAAGTTIRAALAADHPDRVLDLIGTGIDLQLVDVTVAGGDGELYGGGVRSEGDGELSLERVVVRDNRVRGMAALGYGGGVYKGPGRLVMRDASVLANSAVTPGYGGGIFLAGPTTAATLTNVTIAGNSANNIGGGVATNGAALGDLTHVTIVENRAGLSQGGIGSDASALRLRSSIVSANIAPTDPNCGTSGFAPASDGGNVGDRACGFTQPTDAATFDARLGALGGVPIPVYEPLADSPAIDRAVGACPPADARGVARPQGAACDAGAAERPVPAPPNATIADTTKPVLSRVSLTRRVFRVGSRQTAVAAATRTPAGTVVRYTLSEAANVTVRIGRALRGRRVGGRCLKATRARRSRPRCTRYSAIKPALTRRAKAGANRLAFSGRIGRKALRRGRYRAVLTATDAAGNRSARRTLSFEIVR